MEEKPNLDMVILAVSTLYKNPDKKEKDKASEWLLHLQNSVSIKKIYFHSKFIILYYLIFMLKNILVDISAI